MDIIGVVRDSMGPYSAICGTTLTCRHDCTHDCKEYNIRRDGPIVERTHGGVVGRTRPAAIAVELHAMARVPVSFAWNPAKLAAFIQSISNSVRNLACRALRLSVVLSTSQTMFVRHLVTSCYAQSVVQRR
jgi:hypothetical protein